VSAGISQEWGFHFISNRVMPSARDEGPHVPKRERWPDASEASSVSRSTIGNWGSPIAPGRPMSVHRKRIRLRRPSVRRPRAVADHRLPFGVVWVDFDHRIWTAPPVPAMASPRWHPSASARA